MPTKPQAPSVRYIDDDSGEWEFLRILNRKMAEVVDAQKRNEAAQRRLSLRVQSPEWREQRAALERSYNHLSRLRRAVQRELDRIDVHIETRHIATGKFHAGKPEMRLVLTPVWRIK